MVVVNVGIQVGKLLDDDYLPVYLASSLVDWWLAKPLGDCSECVPSAALDAMDFDLEHMHLVPTLVDKAVEHTFQWLVPEPLNYNRSCDDYTACNCNSLHAMPLRDKCTVDAQDIDLDNMLYSCTHSHFVDIGDGHDTNVERAGIVVDYAGIADCSEVVMSNVVDLEYDVVDLEQDGIP